MSLKLKSTENKYFENACQAFFYLFKNSKPENKNKRDVKQPDTILRDGC